MLFIVIERFGPDNLKLVGERYARYGRMLPDDVTYESSWMEPEGGRCFQLMRAPTREALAPWIARWDDLVAFEVIAVVPSAEFWAARV